MRADYTVTLPCYDMSQLAFGQDGEIYVHTQQALYLIENRKRIEILQANPLFRWDEAIDVCGTSRIAAPAISENHIYVGCKSSGQGDADVLCLDRTSHALVWKAQVQDTHGGQVIACKSGGCFVFCWNGIDGAPSKLIRLSDTGQLQWEKEVWNVQGIGPKELTDSVALYTAVKFSDAETPKLLQIMSDGTIHEIDDFPDFPTTQMRFAADGVLTLILKYGSISDRREYRIIQYAADYSGVLHQVDTYHICEYPSMVATGPWGISNTGRYLGTATLWRGKESNASSATAYRKSIWSGFLLVELRAGGNYTIQHTEIMGAYEPMSLEPLIFDHGDALSFWRAPKGFCLMEIKKGMAQDIKKPHRLISMTCRDQTLYLAEQMGTNTSRIWAKKIS